MISLQSLRWLLKDKYHWLPSQIDNFVDQKISGLPAEIQADIHLLEAGEPLQYVIGWAPFLDCHIDLSLRPLIPRPETEFWVGELIRSLPPGKKLKILDLCCGSGCIGIALLKHVPNVDVTFVDISDSALKQTAINFKLNHISPNNFQLMQSNLFAQLTGQTFDLIVTNPPYVDPSGKWGPELKYEPPQALFAEKNGLAVIEKILTEAQKFLTHGGQLWLEFGIGQEKKIGEYCQKTHWVKWEVKKDQYGVERYLIAFTESTSHPQN